MPTSSASPLDAAPDLVSVGRISVDLYGEQIGADLSRATTYRRFIGGSAANIAVGTSRLGLQVAMIARIGADGLGDFLVEELNREEVDTRGLVRDPQRPSGTIVLAVHERTDFPRSFLVADPAEFNLDAGDVDTDLIQRAGAVVLTGSLLSRPGLAAAAHRAIEAAQHGGTQVVFDIDYRPAFWGVVPGSQGQNLTAVTPEVTRALQQVLPACDVLVGTEAEINVMGGHSDVEASLREIRAHTDATIVYKVGAEGSHAFTGPIPQDLTSAPFAAGFRVQVLNNVGAGDAFLSGFLRGHLRAESIETCLRWGNASGAIVVGRLGCSGDSPSMTELEEFIDRAAPAGSGRPAISSLSDRQFDTATRHRRREALFVLALDHRDHFERLAAQYGAGAGRIADFKQLVAEAFLTSADLSTAGILLDDQYTPAPVREAITDSGLWNAGALEVSGRTPVRFAGNGDVAGELRTWPAERVVKVLVTAGDAQDEATTAVIAERLHQVSRVCRNLGRDLLLEILPPPGTRHDATSLRALLQRWYSLGIKPAWWKLPALPDGERWSGVTETVEEHDPACRGILLLGGGTSREDLRRSFTQSAGAGSIRGFALGRPLFHDAARDWLAGNGTSEQAAATVLDRYREAVDLWQATR